MSEKNNICQYFKIEYLYRTIRTAYQNTLPFAKVCFGNRWESCYTLKHRAGMCYSNEMINF